MHPPLITQFGLNSDTLHGETIIVTGAGGGIGFEAARALLWLGANVIIAEISELNGTQAAEILAAELDPKRICFIRTDIGDVHSVENLHREALLRFGKVDGVINNATIAEVGQVIDLPIETWDDSYRVNLRGPVLMARTFLPDMVARKHGTFVCVSSTGTAYLGSYETFKAAQVHLSNTLDAELEGTGVVAFTIGPGLIPTRTASEAIQRIAPLMGMTVEEFYQLNKNALLTAEEAGVGFALSVVYAERFKGMEISSLQALKAADINYGSITGGEASVQVKTDQPKQALIACQKVLTTLSEQSQGWKHRSLFERQWVIRDFRKTTGMSAEEWLDILKSLELDLKEGNNLSLPPLSKLAGYYDHLAELAKGYEKDPAKLQDNLQHVYSWRDEVVELEELLKPHENKAGKTG